MRGLLAGRAARACWAGAALAVGFAATARAQQGEPAPAESPIESSPLPAPAGPPAKSSPPPAPTPAAPERAWLPRSAAKLQVLNKVDATVTNLSIAVGKTATLAALTITVEACEVRPSNQPRDAAAYVAISDKSPGVADFHGWLLAAEPAVSVFPNPIYDVRVTGCGGAGVAPARH